MTAVLRLCPPPPVAPSAALFSWQFKDPFIRSDFLVADHSVRPLTLQNLRHICTPLRAPAHPSSRARSLTTSPRAPPAASSPSSSVQCMDGYQKQSERKYSNHCNVKNTTSRASLEKFTSSIKSKTDFFYGAPMWNIF